MKKMLTILLILSFKAFSQTTVIKIIDKCKYLSQVDYIDPDTKFILNFKPKVRNITFDENRVCLLRFNILQTTELYLLGTSVLIEPNDSTEINVLPNGGKGYLFLVNSKFRGNFLWRQKLDINNRKALEISNNLKYPLSICKVKLYENYLSLKDSLDLFCKVENVSEKAKEIFGKELFYYYLKTLCERFYLKIKIDSFENSYFKEFQYALFNDKELLNTSLAYRNCLMLFFDDVTERFSTIANYLDLNIYLRQIEKIKNFESAYTKDFLYAQMVNYYYIMKNDLNDDVSGLLGNKERITEYIKDQNFKNEISLIIKNDGNKHEVILNDLALKNIFLRNVKNKEVSLYDFLLKNFDKVIVLDIWATWCVPCLNEFRYYPALIKNVKNRKLVIVTVSIDENRERWLKKIKNLSIGFDYQFSLRDTSSITLFRNNFSISEIPRTVIYNEGNQISNFHAATPSSGNQLEHQIKGLLRLNNEPKTQPLPPPPPSPVGQ